MIQAPTSPVVSRANSLTAIYVPPLCAPPPEFVENRLQVIVSDPVSPRIRVVPPSKLSTPTPDDDFHRDSIVLALEPQLFDRRITGGDSQEAADPYLFTIADTMRCGFRLGQNPPAIYLESLVRDISEHMRHHYPVGRRKRERRGLSQSRLGRALALIEERLADPLAVNEIAAAVHLSPFHFARMFRRSTNQSPHEFITQRRLARAKQLLAESDLTMLEIAHTVGYRTQAHFTRVFHEGTGTTPRRYRLAHRIITPGR